MKKNDLLTIATVALGTATLTVAALLPGPIEAGAETDAPAIRPGKARLVSHGVEMTLAAAGDHIYKAGDQPQFELTALNTTREAANVSVCVNMAASAPVSAFSRVMNIPMVLWQQEQIVKLLPNEQKTFPICAATNLPPNKVFTVTLHEPGQQPILFAPAVMALTFSTVTTNAAPGRFGPGGEVASAQIAR